ncbi:MAG: hemerythrin domain-containing protein [Candidatus Omnitrophota bacterium]
MWNLKNLGVLAAAGLLWMTFVPVVFGSPEAKPASAPSPDKAVAVHEETSVTAIEDLMREHGVLDRVLLIYEELLKRLEADEPFPAEALREATDIIRGFIQDYHEKLEEKYVFVKFRYAQAFEELVETLRQQHERGRLLVKDIISCEGLRSPDEKRKLAASMRAFIRMYRPHKAREDTVLFPTFRTLLYFSEYDMLGDIFEQEEARRFGGGGFEKIVSRVEHIEKMLGIYDLSSFTPIPATESQGKGEGV